MRNVISLVKAATACAALLVASTAAVDAGFSAKVTVGANMLVIVDNDANDTNKANNQIGSNVTVGGYNFNIIATTDAPGVGNAGTVTNGTIAVRRTASAVGDNVATVELISTNFTVFPLGQTVQVDNAIATTLLRGSSTATGSSTYDGQTTTDASVSGPVVGGFAADATTRSATTNNSPTTISNLLTFTGLSNTNNDGLTDANVNLTTAVTAVVPVPPALALLASALPFAIFMRRRKA